MDDFRLDFDPDCWLRVPTEFPDDADLTASDWAARQAGYQRERGFRETADSGTLDQYFLTLVDVAQQAGGHGTFWAMVAQDAPSLVALTLDVTDAVGSVDDLLLQVTSRADHEYEPAQHRPLRAKGLGDGVQVSRLDVDADGHVYQTQFLVFRHRHLDYVVATQSFDIAALAWAEVRIQEFVDGIVPSGTP